MAVASLALLMLAPGCKPTERNYKSAYDAALAKRQAADTDMNLPVGALMVEGEPSLRQVDGRDVYWLTAVLRPVTEGARGADAYNVAVGSYKVPTNALDQSRALRDEGLDAYACRGENDHYYTVAGSFDTAAEALAFIDSFRDSHPEYPHVGLPDIIIIEKTR